MKRDTGNRTLFSYNCVPVKQHPTMVVNPYTLRQHVKHRDSNSTYNRNVKDTEQIVILHCLCMSILLHKILLFILMTSDVESILSHEILIFIHGLCLLYRKMTRFKQGSYMIFTHFFHQTVLVHLILCAQKGLML